MRYPVRLLCICALVFVPLTGCGTEASLCEGVECEDDGNECTDDVCDPTIGTCRHVTVEDDTPCDFDGLPGLCWAGVCVDAALCEGVECEDDGNECTLNECDRATGECVLTTAEDGTECSAGICQEGVCRAACIQNVCHCSEIGIRAAVGAGSHDPYTFDCDGPTTVTTKDEIEIDEDVILDGEGNLTVDGNKTHRVFWVSSRATVELRGMKVVRGAAREDGGGIDNDGALTLTECAVSENAGRQGGGISNAGTLTLSKTTVSSNSAQGDGGGIWNGGMLTLVDSTVADNTAEAGGGAAIESTGNEPLWMINTTVSGNHPASGRGAIEVESWAVVRFSTLQQLPVNEGRYLLAGSGWVEFANTILHGECAWAEIGSYGGNIESPGNTCGLWYGGYYEEDWVDVPEAQLDLGPLQDNGGPTRTHLPGVASFAIDRIDPRACTDFDWEPLRTDQRGETRPLGPLCDVGSVEASTECEGVECDDQNDCTEDRCNPADGECSNEPVEDGLYCDLGSGGAGGTGGTGGMAGAGGTGGYPYMPGICFQGECIENLCLGNPCDDGNDCTLDDCEPFTGQCSQDPVPDGSYCYLGGGGTGGAGGTGGVGGSAGAGGTGGSPYMPGICIEGECVPAPEGACTNEADASVYSALEYDTGSTTLTGSEAASQIASDCVFGNQQATPSNPGCSQQAQDVLICGGSNCPPETIAALTECVVMCQQGLIEEITGSTLSDECSACYGANVTCSAVNCATAGCTVPDSPSCIACRCENDCTPGFDRCSGLPPSGDCG